MNRPTKTFALMLALIATGYLLCIGGNSFAQDKKDPPKTPPKLVVPAEEKEELPTKKEYERALKHYGEWKEKFNNEDFWKNVTLTRVSDKKEFKIKDLDDFDKQGFFLNNLRRCSFEMKRLDGFWQEEVKQYTKTPPTQKDVPTVDELKKYIGDLTKLRKETAVVLEDFAGKFVKQFPDKITKEEGEQLLKSIRDYHDENKLIERKK
jgi:hypothetical protein